jgi:hypothetical protein
MLAIHLKCTIFVFLYVRVTEIALEIFPAQWPKGNYAFKTAEG